MVRGALASADVTGGARPGLSRDARIRLAAPELAVGTAEIDDAGAILVLGCDPMHEMPILELRIRKAVRRNGAQLLVATERPTALDGGAAIGSEGCLEAQRYAPGAGSRLHRGAASRDRLRRFLDSEAAGFAAALRDAGSIVVVWGEGMLAGEDREDVAASLLGLADVLGLDGQEGGGLYEVPIAANGRGLREVGCAEDFGPGFAAVPARGRSAAEIRAALESGEIEALILADVDPIRDFDDPEGWQRALTAADFTLSISMFDGPAARASDVHLPAETHAEKEGTVTHPDGRLQRVRPSVPHPGAVRPVWQALSELLARLGDETGAGTSGEVFSLLAGEVPFYSDVTLDRIGGMGVRWQEIEAPGSIGGERSGRPSSGAPAAEAPSPAENIERGSRGVPAEGDPDAPLGSSGSPAGVLGEGELRLGTYRDLWADLVSDESPALRFLAPEQTLELNPLDAERLGVQHGQRVQVTSSDEDQASLIATVGLRERMLEGTAFLIEGTATDGANRLAGATAISVGPRPPTSPQPDAPAADRPGDGDEEVPAAPALIVTKREPADHR